MSNPIIDKTIGEYIKKTMFQFYHSSISIDDFIDKCDRLSMQSNSLQIRQAIKIQRTHYINLFKQNGQEYRTKGQQATSNSKISEKTNAPEVANKRKVKHGLRLKTLEDRHNMNGDKSVEMGYSSTGVPLPTEEQIAYFVNRKKKKKKKKYSKASQPFWDRRFILVPMGGKPNRY